MKTMNLKNWVLRHAIIFSIFIITACGGGGSSSPSTNTPIIATSPSNLSSSSASSSLSTSSSESSSSSTSNTPIITTSSSTLSSSSTSSSVATSSSRSSSSSTSSARTLSKIEIHLPEVDDWMYLTVNGLRHRIGYWGQPDTMGEWRDISDWFSPGDNQVQLQAINYGGPRAIKFEMRVDGIIVASLTCPSVDCPDSTDSGTFLQKTIMLTALHRPAASIVNIDSPTKGKLYINDEYIGMSTPTSLTLPQGTYKIGLGISNDNPQDLTDDFFEYILALGKPSQYNLTGSFYEQKITVNETTQSIYIDTNLTPLAPQNTVKIAILPFENVMSNDMKSPLILTQEMLDGFAAQVRVTGERLAMPSMYGLSKWDVTVLPMDKILNVHAKNTSELVDTLYSVSWRPEYQSLFDFYDVVVIYQSSYHADGEVEPIFAGGMSASGRLIHVTSGWTWTLPSNAVNRGFYHEMYHHYESWEVSNHHYYNGIGGLHGEREHGFTGGGASVQEYYRLFARGQAGEDPSAKIKLDWPIPLANAQPFPIGVFHAVRYGRLPKNSN